MSKHTQGPWRYSVRRDGGADIFGPEGSSGFAPFYRHVARVVDVGALVGEAEANARLIKEAPELFEVCKDALAAANGAKLRGWEVRAEAAIRNVTGNTP